MFMILVVKELSLILNLLICGVFLFSGCNHSRKSGHVKGPSIYEAWNARYHYDSDNRKMIPYYKEKQAGRAWGRDEAGRMNFAEYYGADGEPKEDLLVIHKRRLDQERSERWDEINRLRMKEITERLNGILTEEENDSLKEELIEEENDFMPAPFIPTGLDMEETDEQGTEFSPFSPVPTDEGDVEMSEPSPFMPLLP